MATTRKGLYRHEDSDAAAPVPQLLNRLAESFDDAWIDYTPNVTAESGTLGNVSATGKYKRFGSTVIFRYSITITTAGTAAGALIVSLPFGSAPGIDFGAGRETLSTGAMLVAQTVGSTIQVRRYDNASMIASSRRAAGTITYETSAA